MFFLFISFKELENTIATLTTKTLEHHLRKNKDTRDALFIARDEVPVEIKCCSDNVKLVFHLDSVLKDPIYLTVGSAENCLHISITSNGKREYYWKKWTWKVTLWSNIESFRSVLERKSSAMCNLFADLGTKKCVEKCYAWCFPPAPEQRSDKNNI